MEETREETPQDLRNLALKVAGLLEEAGQHALHDQLNPRNLAQPSTENADRGPRYKLEVDNKIMRSVLAPGASIGLHTHETSSEVMYFLSGTGKVLYDGVWEPVAPGTCLLYTSPSPRDRG